MFPPANTTSHKPMFQIFWNNDTHFKELINNTISFSLPFQMPEWCVCVCAHKYIYINIYIYIQKIYVCIYTHTYVSQFSNMQGCCPFLSWYNSSLKTTEHDPQSQPAEVLNLAAAAVNHAINQRWRESSEGSPGSTDQELAAFQQRV